MKKEAKDKHFIKRPIYEGGPQAMKKFIGENLRYPSEALENNIEGTVYVRYDIDAKGHVTDAKVVKGIGHGCDEEALRLAKLLEFEVPKNRGVRVIFHNNIQIHFKLPKHQPAPAATTTIQYNYVENKKEEKPKEQQPSAGYTVTYHI